MIDISATTIITVSVHSVGNGINGEELTLSKAPLHLENDQVKQLLLTYFFSSFTSPGYSNFAFPEDDKTSNPVYNFAQGIFNDIGSLHEKSIDIAKHLFDKSQHHLIKSGDLYVALFSGVILENTTYQAVGIFKCETKETYLKLHHRLRNFEIMADEGINIRKLDKGCLILNVEEADGYKVLTVDTTNKSEAQFWTSDFLNVKPGSDAFHHTHNFMNLTRQYVGDQLDEEFSVSKADKIDMLNRSVNFFKSRDQFNQHEFEAEVLEDPSVIESFRKYEKHFMSDQDIANNFEISIQAVKRQARIFKSVLKLDKNFHIYIHGNRDLVEKGYDEERQRHFYKLYFDEEN